MRVIENYHNQQEKKGKLIDLKPSCFIKGVVVVVVCTIVVSCTVLGLRRIRDSSSVVSCGAVIYSAIW